jgi:hypothetical protein
MPDEPYPINKILRPAKKDTKGIKGKRYVVRYTGLSPMWDEVLADSAQLRQVSAWDEYDARGREAVKAPSKLPQEAIIDEAIDDDKAIKAAKAYIKAHGAYDESDEDEEGEAAGLRPGRG